MRRGVAICLGLVLVTLAAIACSSFSSSGDPAGDGGTAESATSPDAGLDAPSTFVPCAALDCTRGTACCFEHDGDAPLNEQCTPEKSCPAAAPNRLECASESDCPTGNVCCASFAYPNGTLLLTASTCASSCLSTQMQMCREATECSARDAGMCKVSTFLPGRFRECGF
jgi:hypothetical protein